MKTTKNKISLNLNNDAKVTVTGFIAPIEYTQYNFHEKWDALINLRVAEPEKQYSTSIFCDFLPKAAVPVGTSWEIEPAGVLALLKQLHPESHLDMHVNSGDSCGLWACLRAYNDEFADIVFRIHAEFKLENGWFTPSQFAGHLVIDRTNERVAFFQMHVPKDTLNFDTWWNKTGGSDDSQWSTDIGFCPQIELRAWNRRRFANKSLNSQNPLQHAAAAHKLIRCFYKSQQINWVSLEEALEMAHRRTETDPCYFHRWTRSPTSRAEGAARD